MTQTILDGFQPDLSVARERSALLIIDMQNATGNRHMGLGRSLIEQGQTEQAAYRFDRIEQTIVPNIQRLADAFRAAGRPVIYITYGAQLPDASDVAPHIRGIVSSTNNIAGRPEHEIVDDLLPEPDEPVLNKTTIGAFASTGIDALLRAKGIGQVLCTGVSTNYCVGMTAMEAADKGYEALLVSDATGTVSAEMQDAYEETFRRLWGRVLDSQTAVRELSGAADMAAE